MIEWLEHSPADADLAKKIRAAIENPVSLRAVKASSALEDAKRNLDVLKAQVEVAQSNVNACAMAVRAFALFEVSKR